MLAVASRKGGVGKTTLALAVASAFALKRKTLLVDMDQEGDATFGAGGNVDQAGCGALLLGQQPQIQTVGSNLDLLAGNQELEDRELLRLYPEALRDALRPVTEDYEVVVIDSPANNHHLQEMSLAAAKQALLPVNAHPFAIRRIQALIRSIEDRREAGGQSPKIYAVVANMLDLRRTLDREATPALRETLAKIPLFEVRQHSDLAKCTTQRRPFTDYAERGDPVFDQVSAIARWVEKTAP